MEPSDLNPSSMFRIMDEMLDLYTKAKKVDEKNDHLNRLNDFIEGYFKDKEIILNVDKENLAKLQQKLIQNKVELKKDSVIHSLIARILNVPSKTNLEEGKLFTLPDEILLKIFKHLDIYDSKLAVTSKKFNQLLQDPPLLASFLKESSHVLSPEIAFQLAQKCKAHLEKLDLGGLTNHDLLSLLTKECVKLQSIKLSQCELPSNQSLAEIWKNLPKLKFLDLANTVMTAKDITSIFEDLPNLQALDVSFCGQPVKEGIKSLTQVFPNLTSLNLAFCHISDEDVKSLTQTFPNLKSLSLAFCDISDEGITIIFENLQNLESLSITGCEAISVDMEESIPKKLPKLKEFFDRKGKNVILL